MKNIIVMTIKLLAITIIAGLLLGAVNYITKDTIADQEAKKADEARFAAFPEAQSFTKLDIEIPEEYSLIQSVYSVQDAQGNDIGVAFDIITKGYSTGLNMTVGLSAQGTVTGVVIGANQETPGLGAKASEPAFIDQYKDVPFDSELIVVKTPATAQGEIQAITSATITSNAVTYAVNKVAEYYVKVLGMGSAMTSEAVAEQAAKIQNEDMLAAFEGAASFELIDINKPDGYSSINNVYYAFDENDNYIGVLVDLMSKGYSAQINAMVGLSKDGTIAGLVLKANEETPGLGTMVADAAFTKQFLGLKFEAPLAIVKTAAAGENEIQAVSGATISSEGVVNAINAAAVFYKDVLGIDSRVTNEQIAQKEEAAQTQAMLRAFPGAVSFELMDIKIPAEYDRIKNVYNAMDEKGNQLGILADVVSSGRAEELGLLVGLSNDGTVAGLVLKTDAGTPWLGIMVEDSAFTDQFEGVSFETPFTVIRSDSSNEHDIQAVSGATISSRGVAYSVNAAAAFYADMIGMDIVMPTPAPGSTQAQLSLPADRNIKPEDEVRAQAFPEAYSFALLDVNIPESYAFIDSFYTAYDALGNDIGVVAQITANGYNYGINYTIGLSRQGVITGIVFGENLTNPGLGSELDVPYFTEQFIGLPFDKELRVSMVKPALSGEIDAVSGATIMAVDVTYYINETARFYIDVIGGAK